MGSIIKIIMAGLWLLGLAAADVYIIVYFWPSIPYGLWLRAAVVLLGIGVFCLGVVMAVNALRDDVNVD